MSDILSALNTNGSGLDISGLSQSLANAAVAPRRQIVEDRMDGIDVSISAMAEARASLEDLKASLQVITDEPLMQTTSSSSAINATVTDSTKVEPGSQNLNVIALAREQVLQFQGYDSEDATVQGGTITIEFGVWTADEPPVFYDGEDRPSFDMLVPEGASLRDLATQFDGISGVEASIIDVGDGTFTLGILSSTGGVNGMRFTVNATGAAADIDLTTFDTTATIEDHQIRAASDAVLEYNGITVFRKTNEIDDLIDGVELELLDTTGTDAVLTTEIEYEEALARMQVLVAKVNETLSFLTEQTSRGVIDGAEPGALAGETSIEAVISGLRTMMRTEIKGFDDTSYYMSDFGISVLRTGELELDESKFEEVMADNPESIMALFESQTSASNASVTIAGRPPSDAETSDYVFTRDPDTGDAYLGTTKLNELFPGDGVSFFLAVSGPMSGISLTVPDGLDEFDVSFGRSLGSSLLGRINDILSGDGTMKNRENDLQSSLTDNELELEKLDDKYDTVEARYIARFTAMELMVTQLNSTGSYIEALLDAQAAAARG